MSIRFGLWDFKHDRYKSTFDAADTLSAKRHVQALLSRVSSSVARNPRRYGLTMLVDLPPELTAGLPFTASASAFVCDVADLVGRDAAAVGYDVGGYVSSRDPAFAGLKRTGALH